MSLLKGLVLRFLVGRTVGGVFGTLFVLLLPLAGVLKLIGLPILIVLGVIGAPILVLLAVIGLPLLFVVGVGGALIALLGVVLTLGVLAIKIALPIVLIVWLVRRLRRPSAPPPPPPATGPVLDPED